MFPIQLSEAVEQAFPALRADLRFIHAYACDLDPDIPKDDFHVSVRLGKVACRWSGHAYPLQFSHYRHSPHRNGRISMSLGTDTVYTGVVRLFSHELRHLAQFARGKDQYGIMTLSHMDPRDVEPDALKFEGRMLKHMMLDDTLTWRNEGYANEPVGYREGRISYAEFAVGN